MASITREPIGNLHEKIVLTLSKDDYYADFEKALKQTSKSINVPGFRKGSVPAATTRKMYGQSIFAEEVIRTAEKELDQYLKETKPNIFANPLSIQNTNYSFDMNNPSEYNFYFEIGLKPEFEITPLDNKGSLSRNKLKITDKMIDEEVLNIRKRMGSVDEIIEPEENSNIVITFELSDQEGNVLEGANRNEHAVDKDAVPLAFFDLFKDQKAGFSTIIQPSVLFSEEEFNTYVDKNRLQIGEDTNESFNGWVKVTIHKIERIVPAELNEELYKRVFPNDKIEDEAAFRVRIKEELDKESIHLANQALQNDIFETLVHETPIELPVEFLKSWLQRSGEKPKTAEEVEKEFSSFEHQLKWELITEKLYKQFDINVSYDEVIEVIKNRVKGYFGIGDDGEDEDTTSWINSYMEKLSKDEKTINETYRQLMLDRLFTNVAQVMEVQDKELDEEELANLKPVHYHHH